MAAQMGSLLWDKLGLLLMLVFHAHMQVAFACFFYVVDSMWHMFDA